MGTLPAYLTVVFSPVPTSSPEQVQARLDAAHAAIRGLLRRNRFDALEAPPPTLSIHYDAALALEECPTVLQWPSSLYAKEVLEIVKVIDGSPAAQSLDDQLERARRDAFALLSEAPGDPEGGAAEEATPTLESNPFAEPAPWHWPLQTEAERRERLHALVPEAARLDPARMRLLDGLAWSISLSVEEKRTILARLDQLTAQQVSQLHLLFQEEQSKFMTLWVHSPRHRDVTLGQLFEHQRAWAELVLEDPTAARKALVVSAVEGRGPFSEWERWPRFWLLAAAELAKDPGQLDAALTACRRAIALDSASALHWAGLADLLGRRLGRYEEAEQAYRKAIDIEPENARIWDVLGDLLQDHLGRYEEAEQAYRKAIDLDPKLAHPWNGLGNLLSYHLGRYEEAEQAYRKAIDLDPELAHPWNGLGNLLQDHLGRYEEAEQAYRKAIDLDPKRAHPWNGLGLLYADHLCRVGDAIRAYEHGLSVEANEPYLLMNRGRLLLRAAAQRQGLEALTRAYARFRDRAEGAAGGEADHCISLRLAIALGEESQALELAAGARRALEARGHAWRSLAALVALAGPLLSLPKAQPEVPGATLRPDALNLQSWKDASICLRILYEIGGLRPELREGCRRMTHTLLDLPESICGRFGDVPISAVWREVFRAFVEGESDGLGDARDWERLYPGQPRPAPA